MEEEKKMGHGNSVNPGEISEKHTVHGMDQI